MTADTDTALPPELADLAAVAAAADAQLAQAGQVIVPGQEPPPGPETQGPELGDMLKMAVMMATPVLPFLPMAYTPQVCDKIGVAFAQVAAKHGWDLSFTNSPELALAAVSIPPTISAVMLGRQYFAHKAAEAEAAARQNPFQPAPMEPVETGDQHPQGGDRVMPGG